MLSGNWKNFDELEDAISYPELVAMVAAQRERDHRTMKFQAALQGVDLDKNKKEDGGDRVEQIKRRVRAKAEGKSEDRVKFEESVAAAGFKVKRV